MATPVIVIDGEPIVGFDPEHIVQQLYRPYDGHAGR